MVKADQVRAWLASALGQMLSGIALTPNEDLELLAEVVSQRLGMASAFAREADQLNFAGRLDVDYLYNASVKPHGLSIAPRRQGQGSEWRDGWGWMSHDLEVSDMRDAVRITSGALRSEALLIGLREALAEPEGESTGLALCVVRRWLLALHALLWLEEALDNEWVDVRPRDLACFAHASLARGNRNGALSRRLLLSGRQGRSRLVLIRRLLYDGGRGYRLPCQWGLADRCPSGSAPALP